MTILLKILTLSESYSLLMVPFGVSVFPASSVAVGLGMRYVVSEAKVVHFVFDVPDVGTGVR